MRKLSENCGKAGKVSVHMDKGFGFPRLETRTLEGIVEEDLDNLPLEESSSAYACSLPSSSVRIQGTEPNLFCLAMWRAVVTKHDQGRPSGRGIDEFSGSRLLRGSRCNQCSLLGTFPWTTVTMMKTGFQRIWS